MNLSEMRTTADIDVAGRRVLVRADLNVPLRDGTVTDTTRLERLVPSLRSLAERGARVVVLSHFGRPKGVANPDLSLAPVARKLAALLAPLNVCFVADCIGPTAEAGIAALADGDVAVLENLRFHAGEERNDVSFAQALAANGDLFVGDAFSCAHRAHASTDAIARLLPAYAGALMMEEIAALRAALEQPERPAVAVVGGAKVSTKIPVLTNLVGKLDKLIIGGGMANTFLQVRGYQIGNSLAEPNFAAMVADIQAAADAAGCDIVLPVDAVVAPEFKAGAPASVVNIDAVPDDAMILDVGPASVANLTDLIGTCRTLLWNGPLGAFEIEPFGQGTFALAREAAKLTAAGNLVSVAGGGDTVAALNAAGVTGDFTYVSTAGGAFLEWLEGKALPGIVALMRAAAA